MDLFWLDGKQQIALVETIFAEERKNIFILANKINNEFCSFKELTKLTAHNRRILFFSGIKCIWAALMVSLLVLKSIFQSREFFMEKIDFSFLILKEKFYHSGDYKDHIFESELCN